MRSLALMAAAMLLFGCSSAFAQQVRSTSARNAPAMRMTSPAAVPGATVGASAGTALGSTQLNLGALGPTSGSAVGTITTCPTAGIATAAPSTTFDASSAVGTTGMLSPQPLPGATPLATSSFGTSVMSGTCDPTASAQAAIEASGTATAVSPIPGLATITGPAYSDATIPTAAAEAGAAGLSPLIIVPTPVDPSTSP